jgi:hypothetical protein
MSATGMSSGWRVRLPGDDRRLGAVSRALWGLQRGVLEVALSVSRTLLQIAVIGAVALIVPLSSSEAQVNACTAPDKQTACAVLCCGRSPCAPSCQSDCVRACVDSCGSGPAQQAFSDRLTRLQARCGYSTAPRRVK